MIILYDINDYELPKFIFDNYKDLANFLNTTVRSVHSQICRGQIIKRKYKAYKFNIGVDKE